MSNNTDQFRTEQGISTHFNLNSLQHNRSKDKYISSTAVNNTERPTHSHSNSS